MKEKQYLCSVQDQERTSQVCTNGIFYAVLIAHIAKILGCSILVGAVCVYLTVVLGRTSSGLNSPFCIQNSTMTKNLNFGIGEKYSIANSTSCHETVTITLSQLQIRELIVLMSTLRGEEAVDCAYLATEFPNSDSDQDNMLKSTLRFYSNVRLLVSEINKLLINESNETQS